MDDAVKELYDAFLQTLTPNAGLIKQAESYLKQASAHAGYGIALLKLIATPNVPLDVSLAAAVQFKNHIKFQWAVREHDGLADVQHPGIEQDEKEQIKGLITDLMLSAPELVRAQLSEALSIISSHDFPFSWPALLPQLIEKLKLDDAKTTNGVLCTAASIFERYRSQFMSEQLSRELEYSQMFVNPLLDALKRLSTQAKASTGNVPELRQLLSSVQLVGSVFYSLNSPGLTDAFEATLDKWMSEFHTFLTLEIPALAESDPDKESVLDAVKSNMCENIILFMERNEEEFAMFLGAFVREVWTLLLKVSHNPGQDKLAMNGIQFLTAVSRSVHFQLFADPGTLRQVCESIIIPNLRIREDVEEMFEMNWVEYVRRDTEGSDSDTRRRAASELVKSLTERFPSETTQLFSGYVATMLADYAQKPTTSWQAKDCAIYLVVALTVRAKTAAQGATNTNQLVNILDFFNQQIIPELRAPDVNDLPILKADAIKFVTTFRSQLPKEVVLAVFGDLVRMLGAESNVTHSYAATCIERLLAMKDGSKPRFTVDELVPHLQLLLERLFAALQLPESGENEYLMKSVMRVISFVGPKIAPVAPICLQKIAEMLLRVCKNPTQPGFNHYLFESVAALIRYGCEANLAAVGTYEDMLFPAFHVVLSEDVQEFHPYVFQIFAQLIELRTAPLPESYMQIFPPLLTPQFWERSGNVPALVRLLQAFLSKASAEIVQRGYLQAVLGVFQKLLASKAHDHEGFFVLNTLIEYLDLSDLDLYMQQIWTLLFSRLQVARTTKFVRCLVVFTALFVSRHGGAAFQASVDQVQVGLMLNVVQNVWLTTMSSIKSGAVEEKLTAAATTRLLCESPALRDPASAQLWGKLLATLLAYVGGQGQGAGDEDDGAGADEEYSGYSAAFAQLHNAHKPERDILPDIKDVKSYLATSLAKASAAQPGHLRALIQAHVPPDAQHQLQAYCQAAGVAIS